MLIVWLTPIGLHPPGTGCGSRQHNAQRLRPPFGPPQRLTHVVATGSTWLDAAATSPRLRALAASRCSDPRGPGAQHVRRAPDPAHVAVRRGRMDHRDAHPGASEQLLHGPDVVRRGPAGMSRSGGEPYGRSRRAVAAGWSHGRGVMPLDGRRPRGRPTPDARDAVPRRIVRRPAVALRGASVPSAADR